MQSRKTLIGVLIQFSPKWRGYALAILWCLLLVVIGWGVRPPGVLVSMPVPQVVHTSNAKVGVHTRLTDEVETWKIQRTLSLVREMGSPWIVEYFPWAYVERSPGHDNWTHNDVVISHAHNQGLIIVARLGFVPDWARPAPELQETTSNYLDAAHYEDFAAYVVRFVQRYQEQIQHIIIWNEPNLSFEWGYRPVDPAAYVDLLRVVYPAVHEVRPDIIVLAGALAPTLEPEGSPAGLNDLLYLEAMYQAGAQPYFDALAAHTYGLNSPIEETPHPDIINYRRVELLRDIMDAYGDVDKPIYITESGWNDHPRWTWSVSPAQRIEYTLDAYRWADTNWPWCPVVVMWMFRTPVVLRNYQDYYAFVTPEFQLRPIYDAVKTYTGNQ
jgi:hypothetical protein